MQTDEALVFSNISKYINRVDVESTKVPAERCLEFLPARCLPEVSTLLTFFAGGFIWF